ncbi:hypothetical protein XM52_22590 [Roseovarius indicus]|uniref:Uncharacterized protein n=1 Tax=Roseovarius indicus TaxID=540747 RepID=A0A0T5P3E0_9RHOB|nr:hypothetical protein XM52_22590 [Roseovarius indicus]
MRNRAHLLEIIREEQRRGEACPCGGSNEMCGCQNRPNRKEPCGECHLQPGETCDICGAQELAKGSV